MRRFRTFLYMAFAILALLLTVPWLYYPGSSPGDVYRKMWPSFLVPATLIAYPCFGPHWMAKQSWKLQKLLREHSTYTFSEAGIRIVGETFEAMTTWANIESVSEAKELVMMAANKVQFHLIPTRVFDDGKVPERFKLLVEAKVRACVWREQN